MQLFFNSDISNDTFTLNHQESKHICKVLKKNDGDKIIFTDGKGNLITSKILCANHKETKIKVINREIVPKKHNHFLHIAISPTKNIDRFKFFIEKATEIGIDEITPLICSRSERKFLNMDRMNKVLISAIKQSMRFHLPKLNPVINFNSFIKMHFTKEKYIAHCATDTKKHINNIKFHNKILLLIGPEGDFSSNEIFQAQKNNFIPISLGDNRLRTETAGIVATNTINVISNL